METKKENKEKKENKASSPDSKKIVSICLSPDINDRRKEIGLNLSDLVERTLKWTYSQIDSGDLSLLDAKNLRIDRVLQKQPQNKEPQMGFEPMVSSLPRTLMAYFVNRGLNPALFDFDDFKIFLASREGGGMLIDGDNLSINEEVGRRMMNDIPVVESGAHGGAVGASKKSGGVNVPAKAESATSAGSVTQAADEVIGGDKGVTFHDLPLEKIPVVELPRYTMRPARPGLKAVPLDEVLVGYPAVDIPTFYADERVRAGFLKWCDSEGIEGGPNGRRTRYDNALKKLAPVYSTDDRLNYADINEGVGISQMGHNAIGALFRYCKKDIGLTTFNGEAISDWTDPKKGYKYGGIKDEEARMAGRFYNLDNSAVTEALYKLPQDIRTFYMLMAYSGARASQLFKLLRGLSADGKPIADFKRRVVVKEPDKGDGIVQKIIALDARGQAHGNKSAFFYMFPPELEDVVRTYVPKAEYAAIMTALNDDTKFSRVNDMGEAEVAACNANSIRKWGSAVMMKARDDRGVKLLDNLDINIIQGRVGDEDVLTANYGPKLALGSAAYSLVVDKFREVLPVSALSAPNPAGVPAEGAKAGKAAAPKSNKKEKKTVATSNSVKVEDKKKTNLRDLHAKLLAKASK